MRMLKWAREEFRKVFPAVLYFFCAINLFNLTFGWMMESEGIRLMTFPRIIISSLIIGKVMLIADAMPFLNIFSSKPLIYNTLWKTSIYSFFGFLFLAAEKLVPFFFKYSMGIAWQRMVNDTPWPRFCTAQIWLTILFLLFVVFRELHIALGKDKLRQIFFGK
ncbi:MAG: hypothetical protein PHX20_00360 [Candidatus Omnitrophica bacterium]|nr:hypothetical protein [Candidatus Omnitrophota bacterium]MDD5435987.1 hypothetical protein [Candidatus Omnitrophota bacterium]